MRDRIRGALLDFNLVSNQLDEHDRELIFQGIDGSSAKRLHDDLYEASESVERLQNARFAGVLETIAFLFAGLRGSDVQEVPALRAALTRAERRELPSSLYLKSVRVDREYTTTDDVDAAVEKIRTDEQLSESDIEVLCGLCNSHTDRFVELLTPVPFELESVLDRESTLSPGKSLVMVAQSDVEPDVFTAIDQAFEKFLADEVVEKIDFEYQWRI